jgi:hypothetical protein
MYVLQDSNSYGTPCYFAQFIWARGKKHANTATVPAGTEAAALYNYEIDREVERFATKRAALKGARIVKRVSQCGRAPRPVKVSLTG